MPNRTVQRSRRRLVQTAAVGTVLALAGCLGTDDDEADPDSNEPAPTNESDSTDDSDDTDDGAEPASPATLEGRAREFVELLDAGELDAAYELVSSGFAD